MSIRIIGGRWRGRRLTTPPGRSTRPLPDRIKQSLFDILGQDLSAQRVADVCAGSGAFGFEAASRGAARVHLIEHGAEACRCLEHNRHLLGDPDEVILERMPFQAALARLHDLDLVFCDPPFPWFRDHYDQIEACVALALGAVHDRGIVLLRGERGQDPPFAPDGARQYDLRRWGRSWIAFLTPTADDADGAARGR